MTDKLEGQVAVITGGSEGIGKGIAKSLAHYGANVYLIARSRDKLKQARDEINREGKGRVEIESADITNLEVIKNIVDRIYNEKGRLDIFVNNAGAWKEQTIDTDEKKVKGMRALTRDAPVDITEYLIRKFKDSSQELKILSVVSQAGLRFLPGNLGYGVGKKGLAINLLELQGEIERGEINNIRLYGLYPATVATPNLMQQIRNGKLQNATSLDSVVETAMDLLFDKTPTRHAYIGYLPGKGIVRKYLEVNPKEFWMFPQAGEDHIIDSEFTPDELLS